ncbi:larval/pupal cuticle protein H1C-like [Aricia agestis]|uniref:larval/pupal cuticle protein H1C-like n=1 Tax=Aricia agestis TaxID=91739 RepID=UPI001C207D17|nr:larval/pupal cuticle protein H1C-like [Aricia agestis]
MQSLVVFLAVAAVARASLLPLAQPAHHPAIVLDPHGRPLDTAEVIGARALHYQAKALEHGYLGNAAVVAAPAWGAHSALASPLLAHSGYGHFLNKRSLGLYGAHAYSAPIIAPSAVSHQSRVDISHSPAIVSHAVAAPVYAAAPSVSVWGAHGLSGLHASPLLAHGLHKRSLGLWGSHAAVAHPAVIATPAHAVTHQSRVDVHHSPAIVSHAVAAPVYSHVAAPVVAHALPAAVSHQSRVDVRTSPAVVAHSVVAAPIAHGVHGVHGLHGW